ncbi:MAG: type II toxin-antitoxin system VapC family toxin [Hyphomicrobiales bacterium]|nr:type II toxin-antitoxin system VapC family toxin [Hyphomicrobiales bacterium]
MIILDTNVLSEAMKPTPDTAVARWMERESARGLFTTAVSEAEIIYGISILPDGRRKRELETAAQAILALFAERIFPFDSAAAREFALIVADRRRAGRPIEALDAEIAAIARSRGMSVASRDIADFADCGVVLIDPWK